MRVLVTRPAPEAERTARALRALGHKVVVSPVSAVSRLDAAAPQGAFDAVLATSANALRHADPALLERLRGLPFLAVGARTGEAAREAGFADVIAASGSASDLAGIALTLVGRAARLLYLAGQPRKPDLEARLIAADFTVVAHACYAATMAEGLTPEAVAALRDGRLDAALHYSRESASRFARLALAAGLESAARAPLHLCLSLDVAAGLAALGKIRTGSAKQPTEEALLILLDKDH